MDIANEEMYRTIKEMKPIFNPYKSGKQSVFYAYQAVYLSMPLHLALQ